MKNRVPAILGGEPIFKEKLYLTKPIVPDLLEFTTLIKEIFDNRWLTNNGVYVQKLEKELAAYLDVAHCTSFCNGTLALQLGIHGLELSGEVITTPFTFAATAHALSWNNITPVFCDINLDTYNLEVEGIEKLITSRTTAIMPVHVFGNPCAVEEIESIAIRYGLKVIYDAAHAFSVKYKDKSISNYGYASMFSFHATKIFNTLEGGCIACNDATLDQYLRDYMNFGIRNEDEIVGPGINAKMNEMQAAFGLLNLKIVDNSISKRKKIYRTYVQHLKDIPGIKFQNIVDEKGYNYSYMPIVINEEKAGFSRDLLYASLKKENIMVRKYFFPLISNLNHYQHLPSAKESLLPNANFVANRVLCLPIYDDLHEDEQLKIIESMQSIFSNHNQIKDII